MLNNKKQWILILLVITILSFPIMNIGYSKNFDGSSEIEVERFTILSTIKSEFKSKFSKNDKSEKKSRVHPIENKEHQNTCDLLYLYLDDIIYDDEDDFSAYMKIVSYITDIYECDEKIKGNDITRMYQSGKGNDEEITDMTISMCKMCDIRRSGYRGQSVHGVVFI